LTAALAVFCLCAALIPSTASAQPGHWRTEAEFLREAGSGWEKIAPGVYELRRDNGRVTRLGFGVESFRFALEERRAELAEMVDLGRKSGAPGLERRLQKTEETIAFLEESLRKAELELTPEQARLANKDSSGAGYSCGGIYSLQVTFSCDSIVTGTTTSRASWSEFGGAPYDKRLYTIAYAAIDGNGTNPVTDADSSGPITSSYVQIRSEATAGPTFQPWLKGQAYLTVTSGCADYRWVGDDMKNAC
jgi:hypothetical protein